jgi:hypothetical protein
LNSAGFVANQSRLPRREWELVQLVVDGGVVVSSSVNAVKSNCVSKDLLQRQKWVFCSDTYIPKLVSIDNISFKDCETGD